MQGLEMHFEALAMPPLRVEGLCDDEQRLDSNPFESEPCDDVAIGSPDLGRQVIHKGARERFRHADTPLVEGATRGKQSELDRTTSKCSHRRSSGRSLEFHDTDRLTWRG
jgi:hypothetical protein